MNVPVRSRFPLQWAGWITWPERFHHGCSSLLLSPSSFPSNLTHTPPNQDQDDKTGCGQLCSPLHSLPPLLGEKISRRFSGHKFGLKRPPLPPPAPHLLRPFVVGGWKGKGERKRGVTLICLMRKSFPRAHFPRCFSLLEIEYQRP